MTNLNEDDNLAHRTEVKNNELHVEKKDVANKVLRKHEPVDYKREDILKKARAKAHNPAADAKRKISNEMRQNSLLEGVEQYWNTFDFGCCESYDFLEGPIGFSNEALSFQMYTKPQVSDAILEALEVREDYVDPKYHTIGMFEGCFAPIGVMSRNKRVYDEDHYPYLLQNVLLENKVKTRAMLGTIGHHNKKVNDEDLAEEKVSHVITNLEVREREDGTKYLYGRAEILNTKAGRSLRTYYRHCIPLYVSSRGGGKLIDIPGQDYKRVDKTRYYLETFDVVKDPGFLDACPIATVAMEIDESINKEYNGEDEMKNEEQVISENQDMKVDEVIATTVEDAVKPEEAAVEPAHNGEKAPEQEEPKKEVEDDQHEKEVGAIVEEKEETKAEEIVEEKVETSETIEEKCEDKEDDKKEDKEEVDESAQEEIVEEKEETIEEKCGDKEPKKDEEDDQKEEKVEESVEVSEKCDKEEKEDDKKDDKKDDEEVDEDYKAKYEALTPVMEELLAMVKDSAESLKQVLAENAESKVKINELSEKLESLTKVEVIDEAQDDTDASDDTHVDDSDDTDGNDDAMESKEETSTETIEEKCEDKEEKEDKEDEACHESEVKAEELGEQIAESVEGIDLVDTVEVAPAVSKPQVFSVFNKKEDIKPSKWYSRFSK